MSHLHGSGPNQGMVGALSARPFHRRSTVVWPELSVR